MDYMENLRSTPTQGKGANTPIPLPDEEKIQNQLDLALNQDQDRAPLGHDQVRVVIPYMPPSNINSIMADISKPQATLKPNSYQEAIASPQSDQWLLSMKEEINALNQQGTWKEVPKNDVPRGQKILTGKWVYDIKANGRYKSRWVVRGFQQQLDPWEATRSAVVRGTTLRIILHLTVLFNWDIYFIDIKNAFLNGTHSGRSVYLQLPTGFRKKDMICQL